jgi:hypothetical protein
VRRSIKTITRLFPLALVVCGLGVWCTNASAQGAVQASIAGVVRDTSGAVLPGVTIEASSPVLIEKSRTAVSDDTGRYRIIALNPGSYAVTFTLAGFNTVRREAIELTGSLTATIDIEMRVGALEETLTVTGESPIVDVQSIKQQRVIDDEAIHAIPGQRAYHRPGPEITALWNVPASTIAQSLGRLPSGSVANIQTNILTAGELYGDRITQVDMRVAKLVRFGRTRANIGIDVYNLFNSNVPLTYVTTYGTTWGRPQSVLDARFAKFSAQIDF